MFVMRQCYLMTMKSFVFSEVMPMKAENLSRHTYRGCITVVPSPPFALPWQILYQTKLFCYAIFEPQLCLSLQATGFCLENISELTYTDNCGCASEGSCGAERLPHASRFLVDYIMASLRFPSSLGAFAWYNRELKVDLKSQFDVSITLSRSYGSNNSAGDDPPTDNM